MSRQEFSVKTRKAAYDRSGGICECGCGLPFGRERVEYDHKVEAYFGGDNSLENCLAMRLSCHKAKTANNRKAVDKTRRILNEQRGLTASKQKIPGSRGTPFKKKIGGEVVRRD